MRSLVKANSQMIRTVAVYRAFTKEPNPKIEGILTKNMIKVTDGITIKPPAPNLILLNLQLAKQQLFCKTVDDFESKKLSTFFLGKL